MCVIIREGSGRKEVSEVEASVCTFSGKYLNIFKSTINIVKSNK